LPEPDTPVTATKQPSGNATVDVAQVVLARAVHRDHAVARLRRMSGTGIERRPER
jgi:hypothetical protein